MTYITANPDPFGALLGDSDDRHRPQGESWFGVSINSVVRPQRSPLLII
jgi:hypothetical protein